MTNQKIVWGSTVEKSADGVTWVPIPELKGLILPEDEPSWVDATTLDSPGGYREYIPGLKDAGELTVVGGYTPDGFSALHADQATGNIFHFRTTLPAYAGQSSGDVFTCTAYPTVKATNGDDAGNDLRMELKLRMSGKPTYTKGAA